MDLLKKYFGGILAEELKNNIISHKINSRVKLTKINDEPYHLHHSRNGTLARFHVKQDGDELRFNYVSSPGGPNSIGTGLIRKSIKKIIGDHPGVTRITGKRAFGRNKSGEQTDVKL